MAASPSLLFIKIFLILSGIFAGLYLPSAIASLTDWIRREHWGKAMAIHELAPNLGFITAPLIAEFSLKFFNWPGTLALLGICCLIMGFLYLQRGRGGELKGNPPRWQVLKVVIKNSFFWVMICFFAISIGSSLGAYAMMPLFLVTEIGLERFWANTLIGLSRVFGILVIFGAGVITDHFGPRKAMLLFLSISGVLMLLLGLLTGPIVSPLLLFLQAAGSACLFPVGFTILSLAFAEERRSVAVSLIMFSGFILGGGLIPSALGYWAESFSFSSGFILLGIIFLLMLPIFKRLVVSI